MNEEPTKKFTDRRSFEERVFARFEAMDKRFDTIEKRFEGVYARFDVIEVRLEKIESRSYDTKPIWERALAAITQTNVEVGEIKSKVEAIENRLGSVEREVSGLRTDYATLVESQRDFKVKIARRIDLVLETLVDTRENARNSDARLSQLESKLA